ncbi:MAG: hypothetical protein ACPG4M_01760 [Alphaproteobacteria bacterium]
MVCDDPSGAYSQCLAELGWHVIHPRLFEVRSLHVPKPDLENAVVVLPSARAVDALSNQPWFENAKGSLRAVVPGPQTARALENKGLKPVWTAPKGFRQSGLPAELAQARKVYLGDASLRPENLSLRLDAQDRFLPIYQSRPCAGPPWGPWEAQKVIRASELLVLANSRRHLAAVESGLKKLGQKAPRLRLLVAMSRSIAMSTDGKFWRNTSFPAFPNRESMLAHLKALAR